MGTQPTNVGCSGGLLLVWLGLTAGGSAQARPAPVLGPIVIVIPTPERYASEFLPPARMRSANFLGGLPETRNADADTERAEVIAAVRATARGLQQLLEQSNTFQSVRLVENDNPSTQAFGDAAIRIEIIITAAAWERRFRATSMPSHFDESFVALRNGRRQRVANLRLDPGASVADLYAAWVRALPGLVDQVERLAND